MLRSWTFYSLGMYRATLSARVENIAEAIPILKLIPKPKLMPIQKESSSEANFPINEFFTWWRIHVWMVPTKLDWSETKYLEYFQSSLLVFFFVCRTSSQFFCMLALPPSLSLSPSLSIQLLMFVWWYLNSFTAEQQHSIPFLCRGWGKRESGCAAVVAAASTSTEDFLRLELKGFLRKVHLWS